MTGKRTGPVFKSPKVFEYRHRIKLFHDFLADYLQNIRYINPAVRSALRRVSSLRMKRIDDKEIPTDPKEIRLFMVIRNEYVRLPYLLKYYFEKGVNRMFIIDHQSTDDSVSYLLAQHNVHVFQIKEHYIKQPNWIDHLLKRYGVGHWCLVVDADEFLVYPYFEQLSIRDICNYLGDYGYTAFHCLLLDMYSSRALNMTQCNQNDDPLCTAPYFDSNSHEKIFWGGPWSKILFRNCRGQPSFIYKGGVRKRVFGLQNVTLSKFPLFKYHPKMFLWAAAHMIEGAFIADIEGAILHFKFFNDLMDKLKNATNGNRWWVRECETYRNKLSQAPNISLHSYRSAKFQNSHQLLDCRILKTSTQLDAYRNQQNLERNDK